MSTHDKWYIITAIATAIYLGTLTIKIAFLKSFNLNKRTLPKHKVLYDENKSDKQKDFNLMREHYNYVVKQYEINKIALDEEFIQIQQALKTKVK